MPARVYVNPQAGRAVCQPDEDVPWGTSASHSSFRHFEPAEARNCRSEPVHVKPCLAQPPATGSRKTNQSTNNTRKQSHEDFPDPMSAITVPTGMSAYTIHSGTSSRSKLAPSSAHEQMHQQLISKRPFYATSTYQSDQASAQEARHSYFPYRDEFAPRSKQLLYELALEKCSRDSVKSASTAGSVSCFTVESSVHSRKLPNVGRGLSAIASAPSLASSTRSRLPTADSMRIPGGIGSLARRRKEADLRAPAQWEPDRRWHAEKWEQDGPAGLASAYYGPSRHKATCRNSSENMNSVEHIVDGRIDHAARERPSK